MHPPPSLTAGVSRLATIVAGVLIFFGGWAVGPSAYGQGGPGGNQVEVAVEASKRSVVPGEQFAIAVIFDQAEGWHIHTNDPRPPRGVDRGMLYPTIVKVTPPPGTTVWPTQWPEAHEAMVALGISGPVPYMVFEGRAVALIPVQAPVSAKAGETLQFTFAISYQACNDRMCLEPADLSIDLSIPVISLDQAAAAPVLPAHRDFARFDAAAFGQPPVIGPGAKVGGIVKFDIFGWRFEINAGGGGLVLLLLAAAVGGLLLNFTPCVLPVVPLKIMGLSAAAGNPARCFMLGSVMSLGVVAFWLAIGGAIAFVSGFTAISSLFQTPWFSLGVGVFILLMAVGMMGAFVIQLPQAVYLFNPGHESAGGSFLFGVMTAVLSTPCTAPFMGSAAAWAATQNPVITLSTFAAIGAGMALPYLVLSAAPGLVSKIPRTGPASELIKQVMGLLLVAVAVFFIGTGLDPMLREPVDAPYRFHWWIIAGVAVAAMLWLMYRAFQITRRPLRRVFWATFASVFAGVSVLVAAAFTDRGPIPWVGYTPERLAQTLADGRVVVLDFTAEWCLNCKALEAGVLHRPEVVALLTDQGTDQGAVPLKADLTGNNIPGKQKLQELGWVGIPLLVIYGPNLQEPIKYDTYTAEMVREAVGRAAQPDSTLARRAAGSPDPAPNGPGAGGHTVPGDR